MCGIIKDIFSKISAFTEKFAPAIFVVVGMIKIVMMALDIETFLIWKDRGGEVNDFQYVMLPS